jgi:hypothetical protein
MNKTITLKAKQKQKQKQTNKTKQNKTKQLLLLTNMIRNQWSSNETRVNRYPICLNQILNINKIGNEMEMY